MYDKFGAELAFIKTDKSTWLIENGEADTLIIDYSYYANQPDAGACFCNDDQLYVNPVHCCFYVEEEKHQMHTVELNVPYGWQVATSMNKDSHNVYSAASFDELADSPFIASPTLNHLEYKCNACNFHIWIQGNYIPDSEKLIADFYAFTKLQLDVMQDFPCADYHFLIQALPFKFYHGVEHLKSTVLAIGPSDKIGEKEFYDELNGVASHELFHVWNVKTIRPVEMMPYDFSKENYARSGFVYEGVTTYFGDLFLKRCNYFSTESYFGEVNKRLMKHVNNEGRFNQSVAESSFDTWLDGYVPGVPGRKVSIYDEGSLVALMLDILIISKTKCKASLDDVMRLMLQDFGKKKHGYKDSDFIQACENVIMEDLKSFFNSTVFAATDYTEMLNSVLQLAGCYISKTQSEKNHESEFGFRIKTENMKILVAAVGSGSPADIACMGINDELLFINGEKVESGQSKDDPETNIDYLLSKYENQEIEIQLTSFYKKKLIKMHTSTKRFFENFQLAQMDNMNENQKAVFEYWLSRRV